MFMKRMVLVSQGNRGLSPAPACGGCTSCTCAATRKLGAPSLFENQLESALKHLGLNEDTRSRITAVANRLLLGDELTPEVRKDCCQRVEFGEYLGRGEREDLKDAPLHACFVATRGTIGITIYGLASTEKQARRLAEDIAFLKRELPGAVEVSDRQFAWAYPTAIG